MKRELQFLLSLCTICCMAVTCKKQSGSSPYTPIDSSLVNTRHLDYLYTPLTLPSGANVAGVYIYAEAPDYHLVGDPDEGFTCVDDVSRALQVYIRKAGFLSDTSARNKALNLTRFILEMQSPNGYFYNFLFPDLSVNKNGGTSINTPNWWSWRALYALSEASPSIKSIEGNLAARIDISISKLVSAIKGDLVNIPQNPTIVNGIIIPDWLPA